VDCASVLFLAVADWIHRLQIQFNICLTVLVVVFVSVFSSVLRNNFVKRD